MSSRGSGSRLPVAILRLVVDVMTVALYLVGLALRRAAGRRAEPRPTRRNGESTID